MALVRLLLFIALAIVVGSGLLYLSTRNRRYLRFIGHVVTYTLLLLTGVMLYFVVERMAM